MINNNILDCPPFGCELMQLMDSGLLRYSTVRCGVIDENRKDITEKNIAIRSLRYISSPFSK